MVILQHDIVLRPGQVKSLAQVRDPWAPHFGVLFLKFSRSPFTGWDHSSLFLHSRILSNLPAHIWYRLTKQLEKLQGPCPWVVQGNLPSILPLSTSMVFLLQHCIRSPHLNGTDLLIWGNSHSYWIQEFRTLGY